MLNIELYIGFAFTRNSFIEILIQFIHFKTPGFSCLFLNYWWKLNGFLFVIFEYQNFKLILQTKNLDSGIILKQNFIDLFFYHSLLKFFKVMINNCLSFLNLFLVSSYYKFILFKINSYVQMSPISLNFGILKSYLQYDRFILIKWTFCRILAFISSNSSFRNTNDIFYLFLTLGQIFLLLLFLHEFIVNFK